MKIAPEQARAFRLARHHLHERAATPEEAAVAGLQDTPPGSAATALAARAETGPEGLDALVVVFSLRGAPMAVAPADQAAFTLGMEPPDEKAAQAMLASAWPALEGVTAIEALDRVSEAVADALRDGPLAKDDFHQALRERLPSELLWWCRGCGSHHVHPSLWRRTGVRGVLAVVGRDGRSPVFGTPPEPPPVADPGAELARRFVHAYGPATPHLLSWWAGITPRHGRALWARIEDELVEVELDGEQRWALARDEAALADPPAARGVRLLPGLDPLAGAKDRELLVPEEAVRKRIWRMLGGPGMVLADGEVAGLWRPAKKGRRLVVTVEPLVPALKRRADELAAEAERLAPFRGAERGELEWAA
jgi:hypothetical protein